VGSAFSPAVPESEPRPKTNLVNYSLTEHLWWSDGVTNKPDFWGVFLLYTADMIFSERIGAFILDTFVTHRTCPNTGKPGMLSSRNQRDLETKFNGLVLVLVLDLVLVVLVLITIVLLLVHLGLVVSKFDYAKYLLLLAMVTYNSGLKCQSDGTNRKLNSSC